MHHLTFVRIVLTYISHAAYIRCVFDGFLLQCWGRACPLCNRVFCGKTKRALFLKHLEDNHEGRPILFQCGWCKKHSTESYPSICSHAFKCRKGKEKSPNTVQTAPVSLPSIKVPIRRAAQSLECPICRRIWDGKCYAKSFGEHVSSVHGRCLSYCCGGCLVYECDRLSLTKAHMVHCKSASTVVEDSDKSSSITPTIHSRNSVLPSRSSHILTSSAPQITDFEALTPSSPSHKTIEPLGSIYENDITAPQTIESVSTSSLDHDDLMPDDSSSGRYPACQPVVSRATMDPPIRDSFTAASSPAPIDSEKSPVPSEVPTQRHSNDSLQFSVGAALKAICHWPSNSDGNQLNPRYAALLDEIVVTLSSLNEPPSSRLIDDLFTKYVCYMQPRMD